MKTAAKQAICTAEFKNDLYDDTRKIYVQDDTVDPKYPVYSLIENGFGGFFKREFDTLKEAMEYFADAIAAYCEDGHCTPVLQ